MTAVKRCTKCGVEYPATTEFFRRSSRGNGGLHPSCKICLNQYARAWRKKNPEKAAAAARKYRRANLDKFREYAKRYRTENPEKYKARDREQYLKHREHRLAYQAHYRRQNRERVALVNKAWRERNRERNQHRNRLRRKRNSRQFRDRIQRWRQVNRDKVRAYYHVRESRKRNLPAVFTREQWRSCKQYFNNACAYCGRPLKRLCQDHFIPMSKGGVYAMSNIVPACRSCNSSKRDRDFFEWYPCQPFYSRVRERKILKYLGFTRDRKRQLALVI